MTQLLSVAAVAERLGCHPETVLAHIRRGGLRAANISPRPGGRPTWRIDPVDVELWLATRTTSPAPAETRRRRRRADPALVEYF